MRVLVKNIFLFLLFALISLGACHASANALPPNHPVLKAEKLEENGLPNLYKVSDILYRSAQPKKAGYPLIKKLGIKTVINFRTSASEEKAIKELGINYIAIPIDTWNFGDAHVEKFLKIIADDKNYPVLIHCRHGADRTGAMTAVYRMVVENAETNESIAEMTKGGFGFHAVWQNLVKYLNGFDKNAWREKFILYKAAAKEEKEKTHVQN